MQSGDDNIVVSAQIGARNGNRAYYSNSADYDRKRPWIEPVTWIVDLIKYIYSKLIKMAVAKTLINDKLTGYRSTAFDPK